MHVITRQVPCVQEKSMSSAMFSAVACKCHVYKSSFLCLRQLLYSSLLLSYTIDPSAIFFFKLHYPIQVSMPIRPYI